MVKFSHLRKFSRNSDLSPGRVFFLFFFLSFAIRSTSILEGIFSSTKLKLSDDLGIFVVVVVRKFVGCSQSLTPWQGCDSKELVYWHGDRNWPRSRETHHFHPQAEVPSSLVSQRDQCVGLSLSMTIFFQLAWYPLSFIGEESVSEVGRPELTDDPTWMIDPIDGTTNFVHR